MSVRIGARTSQTMGDKSMRVLKTHAAALALAGALVATAATPSLALDRWGAAGLGFAAGTVVGATAANANAGYYYGSGYAYAPYSYNSYGYAYAPSAGYAYAPSAGYAYAPSAGYAYAPSGGYAYAAAPSYYAPAYRRGKSAHAPYFDPENGSDPDPRIGGSVKMNSSGDD
jgi:hypothetical protein